MKKNTKFLLQCADCGVRYKKTIKWLENVEKFDCICGNTLDVCELVTEIYTEKKGGIYKVYPR
jgi:hypothetical protein